MPVSMLVAVILRFFRVLIIPHWRLINTFETFLIGEVRKLNIISKREVTLTEPVNIYDIVMDGDNPNFPVVVTNNKPEKPEVQTLGITRFNRKTALQEASENVQTRSTTVFSGNTRPFKSDIFNITNSRFPGGFRYKTDYSQNEVRVMASISHEQNFIRAFEQGLDPHMSATRSIVKSYSIMLNIAA